VSTTACQKAEVDMSQLPEFVHNFATALFENRDLGTEHDIGQYIQGDNLTTYLLGKIRIESFLAERINIGKEDYTVSTKMNPPEELDKDTYYVVVAVVLDFKYTDSYESDDKSSMGTELDLVVSAKGGKFSIIDAFEQPNYYDETIVMAFIDKEELEKGDEYGKWFYFDLKERFMDGSSIRSFDKSRILEVVKDMEKEIISSYGDG
jgi:hypothetical protein